MTFMKILKFSLIVCKAFIQNRSKSTFKNVNIKTQSGLCKELRPQAKQVTLMKSNQWVKLWKHSLK